MILETVQIYIFLSILSVKGGLEMKMEFCPKSLRQAAIVQNEPLQFELLRLQNLLVH